MNNFPLTVTALKKMELQFKPFFEQWDDDDKKHLWNMFLCGVCQGQNFNRTQELEDLLNQFTSFNQLGFVERENSRIDLIKSWAQSNTVVQNLHFRQKTPPRKPIFDPQENKKWNQPPALEQISNRTLLDPTASLILEGIKQKRDSQVRSDDMQKQDYALIQQMILEDLQKVEDYKQQKLDVLKPPKEENKNSQPIPKPKVDLKQKPIFIQNQLSNCTICLDPVDHSDYYDLLENCQCLSHKACKIEYFRTQCNDGKTEIKCSCNKVITHKDFYGYITDEKTMRQYGKNITNISKPDEFVQCLTPDCDQIYAKDGSVLMLCVKCNKLWCINCKMMPQDYSHICDEYQDELRKNNQISELDKVKEELILAGMRICPQCKEGVEKSEGCLHMKCRCGFEFCYDCCAPFEGVGSICKQCGRAH